MEYKMKLQKKMFEKLKTREKVYEVRLNDEKREDLAVDDIIVFVNQADNEEAIRTQVEDLLYFESFEEMVKILPMKKIGFAEFSEEKVLNMFEEHYSKEAEYEYGVLGIKLKFID